MYVAKARDVDVVGKDRDPRGFHYYLVSRSRKKVVAFRMTHWVDPSSEAIVKGGKGFLHRFSGIPSLSVLLKDEPRTKDVRGRPLKVVESSVFERVGDLTPFQERKVRQEVGRLIR